MCSHHHNFRTFSSPQKETPYFSAIILLAHIIPPTLSNHGILPFSILDFLISEIVSFAASGLTGYLCYFFEYFSCSSLYRSSSPTPGPPAMCVLEYLMVSYISLKLISSFSLSSLFFDLHNLCWTEDLEIHWFFSASLYLLLKALSVSFLFRYCTLQPQITT